MKKLKVRHKDIPKLAKRVGIENAAQLSKISGIPYPIIYGLWINGMESDLRISTVGKLAEALQIEDLTELLHYEKR